MTARSVWLAAGALALAGLIVGLLLLLGSDDRPERGTAEAPSSPVTPAPRSATPRPADLGDARTPAVAPEPVPTRDAEGRVVRDHRGQGPTGPRSPIEPLTLAGVRQALGPQIRACGTLLLDLSPGQRMIVSARINVVGGRVSASDIEVSNADKLGESYVACIQRAYAELATDPPGEQKDGEDLVHMPWTVP